MRDDFRPEIYAIDFGTSNSLLAAADSLGTCPPIPLDPAARTPRLFRSILFFSEESRWSFGAEALRDYVASGMRGRFLRSIKRFLAASSFGSTQIGTQRLTLEEIVSVFLREMRLRANAYFGADVRRTVLGRPARFSDDAVLDELAQHRLQRAAELAGFEEVYFCPEPVAAAYHFQRQLDQTATVLIADFGGGTSDYTVVRLSPRDTASSQVLAIGGVTLAGDALDGVIMRGNLVRYFGGDVRYRVPMGSNVLSMPRPLLERLCSPAETCLLQRREVLSFIRDVHSWSLGEGDRLAIGRLLTLIDDCLGFQLFEVIERAKCELSTSEQAELVFDYPEIQIRELVLREIFEQTGERVTASILGRLDDTVRAAGIAFEDIDIVCCTGGTAKVPAIARGIRQRFPARALREIEVFDSVIRGLATRAAQIAQGGADGPG